MTHTLSFSVFGVPESQGSMKAYVRGGKAVITSSNEKLRPWRESVTWAARDALGRIPGWTPIEGPVMVGITFYMPRPKSAPKTRDIYPITGKDLDKMCRSTLDSMTNAGVYIDDSQVVDMVLSERYAVGPHLTRLYDPLVHRAEPGIEVWVLDMEKQ